MSVIRVGSTSTYADGWEQIFGGAGARKTKVKRPAKQASRKKAAAAKKPAARKAAPKKRTSRGR